MGLLTKDQFLKIDNRQFKVVQLNQFGIEGEVRLATMSSQARDNWEFSMVDKKGQPLTENFRAKLVAACIVDDKGVQMFTPDEVNQLASKDASIISFLYDHCLELNKMDMKEIEKEAKN